MTARERSQPNGSRPHPIARAVSVDTVTTKPRLSLADLRKAAQARKAALGDASGRQLLISAPHHQSKSGSPSKACEPQRDNVS
jgi:hypothetical protein